MSSLHPSRVYEVAVVVGIITATLGFIVGAFLVQVGERRRLVDARRRGRRDVLRWVGRA